jgi:SAM-dependent MidA family methyltransferase
MKLDQIIIDKIKNEGPITFEAFMDMALYYPDMGYYSSQDTTIGKDGDFYTSPHLHPAFGAMIARQLMEMWKFMQKPSDFHAIEIGAGAGYVCKDIFDYLRTPSEDPVLSQDRHDFLKSLHYVIVEPYPHFEEKQRRLLKYLLETSASPSGSKENIAWVKSLNEMNEISGCILSNELLDAFPVHVVEMDSELMEIYVNVSSSEFAEEKKGVSSEELSLYLNEFDIVLDKGYRTEVNLKIKDWLKDIHSTLSQGFLLTIDYGYTAGEYYSDERSTGTLLCYHKHLYNENPYQHIGQQDMTAHVNFSSLKKWGEELDLRTLGYCPQGTFLIAAGIDEVITELYAGSPDYLAEVSKIKGLIMPQGMGESHSVMIQYKGDGLPELRGFTMRNQMKSL